MMQNWEHVNTALSELNKAPKKDRGIDFSRVRDFYLRGAGVGGEGKDDMTNSNHKSTSTTKFADDNGLPPESYRQLIVLGEISDPNINATFKRNAVNSASGQLKIKRKVEPDDGAIAKILVDIRQVFQKVHCDGPGTAGERRLKYFKDFVLPQLEKLNQSHTLIYVPSYFEFISLRNLLLKREMSFVQVNEYARTSEVSRGRSRFFHGQKPIMLYTGRAHFFKRHNLRGAKHLIFFGLPEHPQFFSDLVNCVEEGTDTDNDNTPKSVLALFNKYESFALERIVGSAHMKHMIKSEKATFMFA